MIKKPKTELTQDEITAWAEQMSGKTVKEIANRHDVTTRTVYNWLESAKKQLGTIDLEEVKGCFLDLIPDAFDTIKHCLTINKDGQVALRLLTGLSVLSDKKDGDSNIQVIVNQEGKAQVEQNRKLAHQRLRYDDPDSVTN